MTGPSWPPTINSVGAATDPRASPARSGLPPRETTAATLPGDLIRGARARRTRDLRSNAAPSHLHREAAAELGPAARVNPPLRTRTTSRDARRRARRHDRRLRERSRAAHARARRAATEMPAPGFSGLEIAVGAYAAALPDLPLAASSSCSRRIPPAFSAYRAVRWRLGAAGRRHDLRRPARGPSTPRASHRRGSARRLPAGRCRAGPRDDRRRRAAVSRAGVCA